MGSTVFPAAGGGVNRKQVTFTSSGTFTLPSGYDASNPLIVDIEICGGGGGGGAGAKCTNAATPRGGSGGGSGVVALYKNVALTSNATITIGAGGNGGTGSATTSNGADGTSGGASNVNSIYYAPGGGAGSGGWYQNTTRIGYSVLSHGFIIMAGFASSSSYAPGAAGGSGSAQTGDYASSDGNNTFGGSKGSSGYNGPASVNPTIYTGGFHDTGIGRGLGSENMFNNTYSPTSTNTLKVPASNELLLLQRGAGGSGAYTNNDNTSGGGGAAGTRNTGGASGFYNTSTGGPTGSANGAAATDAGCGGGGGGGRMAASGSGASGNGAAGAAGYCIITYWA